MQNPAGKPDYRESGLVQRMRQLVRQLPVENPNVLLACSGGKDSVGLAWLLSEMQRLGLLTFSLAHIHHGQHDQADLAADAVKEIGKRLNVPASIHHLQLSEIDAHQGVGLEEAMRRERYIALAVIAKEQRASIIALGHHQTDQAETLLLHLMRGAGIDGLAGMRVVEQRAIPWWTTEANQGEFWIWRPLLNESANDVANLATASGLPIIEDPTNADMHYRRNAIRHRALPLLEEIAAGSIASIARSANLLHADADLLESLTRDALALCLQGDVIPRANLIQLPGAMQNRVIRLWISEHRPQLELSANRTDAIRHAALENKGGVRIEIGRDTSVVTRGGYLVIE